MNISIPNKKTFVILWALCVLGSWAILPYMHYTKLIPSNVSFWNLALISTIQAIVFFGLICWFSFKIYPKTDLHPFPEVKRKNVLQKIILPGVISGVAVGLVIFAANKTIFHHSPLLKVQSPLWARTLASLYGSVNEEVALRLFLFTLLYFLSGKLLTKTRSNRSVFLWSINILVALLFGAAHFPAAFQLVRPSGFETFHVLFLNGIAGIVFGWLYWTRGLWAAITAHFVTDLMIHVFLI